MPSELRNPCYRNPKPKSDPTRSVSPEDGQQTANELNANSYSWSYDEVGRLTDEVLNHWDDSFDQIESFTYDLTGNRTVKTISRLPGQQAGPELRVDYTFDANDRLLEEILDDLTATDADTTTTYGYDHTQQTSKTVTTSASEGPITVSHEQRTYNLQGRLATIEKESYQNGQVASRERSSYDYDLSSFRVSQRIEDWNESTGEFEFRSETEFLVDHHNHTGYSQTQRETITFADGSTKVIDYTFGHDEISQTTTEYDSSGSQLATSDLIFGHDGHGSVRVTYSNTAGIHQAYTFTSYGVRIAIHDSIGNEVDIQDVATAMAYSGEFFDAVAELSYNRARFYDAVSAQWNRLDPFAGNMQDPQSLHKYAYVHGDPVQGIDPSGLTMSLGSSMMVGGLISATASIGLKVYRGQVDQISLYSVGYDFFLGAALTGVFYGLGVGFNFLRGSGGEAVKSGSLLSGSLPEVLKTVPTWVRLAPITKYITHPSYTGPAGRAIVSKTPDAAKTDIYVFINQSLEILGQKQFGAGTIGKLNHLKTELVPNKLASNTTGLTDPVKRLLTFGDEVPLSTIFEELSHFRYLLRRNLWGNGYKQLPAARKAVVHAESELAAKVQAQQFGFAVEQAELLNLKAAVEAATKLANAAGV